MPLRSLCAQIVSAAAACAFTKKHIRTQRSELAQPTILHPKCYINKELAASFRKSWTLLGYASANEGGNPKQNAVDPNTMGSCE